MLEFTSGAFNHQKRSEKELKDLISKEVKADLEKKEFRDSKSKRKRRYGKNLALAILHKDKKKFLEFAAWHSSKTYSFTYQTIKEDLTPHEMDEMWFQLSQMILTHCEFMFVSKTGGRKIKNVQMCLEASQILQASIDLAQVILDESDSLSEGLLHMVVFLNGIIFEIPSILDTLRSNITNLCEKMYHLNYVTQNQYFTSNAVIYLIQRSLNDKAAKKEVRRIYSLRPLIPKILAMDSVDKNLMWELFKKCAQSNLYSSMVEGQKIISLSLTMDLDRIYEIHYVIKKKLPSCSKKQSHLYGRAYFDAWSFSVKTRDTELKDELEMTCIQDLILTAICGKSKLLVNSIRQVLTQFHIQKKEAYVSKMLYTLYQPILWRYLKSPDGLIRSRACRLFLDVFPLEDPDVTVVATDMQLNEQLLLIKDLLLDDYPIVRTTAVNGLCFTMSAHWELFPDDMKKTFFKILVNDLSRDSSSIEVRAAVAKGIKALLENPLTLPTLQSILPNMLHLFHDQSDIVRIAFCQLLLRVKKICAIKYYDIISTNELLARMEVDPVTARILVNLLHNSFFPKDSSPEVWLLRCANAIREFPAGSRVLFSHLPSFISVQTILQYITQAAKCIHCFVLTNASKKTTNNTNKRSSTRNKKTDSENGEKDSSDLYALGLKCGFDDKNVVSGFIDSFVVLWLASIDSLQKPENKPQFKKMIGKLSKWLSELILYYKDSSVFYSIAYLGSFIPAVNMQSLASLCFMRLKRMTIEDDPYDYTPLLQCLCNQRQGDSLLNLLKEWIDVSFHKSSQTPKSKRRKKSEEIFPPQPLLGVQMLGFMLRDKSCQKSIIEENTQELSRFLLVTDELKARIESLHQKNITQEDISFYSELVCNLLVISIILFDEDAKYPSVKFVSDIVMWVQDSLLKVAFRGNNDGIKSRKSGKACSPSFTKLVSAICKDICAVSGDMKLCGISNLKNCKLMEFGKKLLNRECGTAMIMHVSKLLTYHVASGIVIYVLYKETGILKGIPDCFAEILKHIHDKKFFDGIPANDIREISNNLSQSLLSMCHHGGVVRDTLFETLQNFVKIILDSISQDISKNWENFEKNCEPFTKVKISKCSAFLLAIVCARQKVLMSFLKRLNKYITASEKDVLLWIASCIIIIHTVETKNVSKHFRKEVNSLKNTLGKAIKEIYPVKPSGLPNSQLQVYQTKENFEDGINESAERDKIKMNFEVHCHLEMMKLNSN